jgi:hypothetical protein
MLSEEDIQSEIDESLTYVGYACADQRVRRLAGGDASAWVPQTHNASMQAIVALRLKAPADGGGGGGGGELVVAGMCLPGGYVHLTPNRGDDGTCDVHSIAPSDYSHSGELHPTLHNLLMKDVPAFVELMNEEMLRKLQERIDDGSDDRDAYTDSDVDDDAI